MRRGSRSICCAATIAISMAATNLEVFFQPAACILQLFICFAITEPDEVSGRALADVESAHLHSHMLLGLEHAHVTSATSWPALAEM